VIWEPADLAAPCSAAVASTCINDVVRSTAKTAKAAIGSSAQAANIAKKRRPMREPRMSRSAIASPPALFMTRRSPG
jgi:hypothetical protein